MNLSLDAQNAKTWLTSKGDEAIVYFRAADIGFRPRAEPSHMLAPYIQEAPPTMQWKARVKSGTTPVLMLPRWVAGVLHFARGRILRTTNAPGAREARLRAFVGEAVSRIRKTKPGARRVRLAAGLATVLDLAAIDDADPFAPAREYLAAADV